MTDLISQWVAHVSQVFVTGNGDNLVASIPLDELHPFFKPLQDALATVPEQSLDTSAILPQINTRPESRDTFASFLVAVLRYVKGPPGFDEAQRAIERFQSLSNAYSEANRLYGTSSDVGFMHPFMNPLVLYFARTLVRVSSPTANLSRHPPRSPISPRSIRDNTRQTIEKSFQVASSSMSDSEWTSTNQSPYMVGDALWPLANILWRIYSSRKLHTQASSLAKAISGLLPHEDKRISARAPVLLQTDICQSHYWRGKLGVVLLEMRNANFWLDRAWKLCPENAHQQRKAILTQLIPVNLLLGRLPSESCLAQYDLQDFHPLQIAFRTGNVVAFRRELESNREWYRRRSIWLILYERGEILVWRNLFRNSLRMFYAVNPSVRRDRCPTWVFLTAMTAAFKGSGEPEEGDIRIEDVICTLSSLIDQSLILGHLSYSQLQLVMKPSEDGMGGFPRISQVVPRHVEANV